MKKVLIVFLVVVMAFTAVACQTTGNDVIPDNTNPAVLPDDSGDGNHSDDNPGDESSENPVSIVLDRQELILEAGTTYLLGAQTKNFEGSIVWSSSNGSVAIVSNGMVKAKKAGQALITATAGSVSATCALVVENHYDGFTAQTINSTVQAYLDDSYKSIADHEIPYTSDMVDYSKPLPVVFDWTDMLNGFSNYTLYIGEDDSFEKCVSFSTSNTSLSVYNLFVNKKYFWKVVADDWESEIRYVEIDSAAPRLINIDGVTNARDLGGYAVADNVYINQGLIYRTSKTSGVTADGLSMAKNTLGIKTEIDLRLESELAAREEGLGTGYFKDGVYYYKCCMDWNYTKDTNKTAVQKFFEILSDRNNYPVAYHCTAGADRTGFMSYLILGLLGVRRDYIYDDYHLTNFAKQKDRERYYTKIKDDYVAVIDAANGSTLSEKIFNYLVQNKGVQAEHLNSMKRIMLENKTTFFDFVKQ